MIVFAATAGGTALAGYTVESASQKAPDPFDFVS